MIKLTLAGYVGNTKFNILPSGDPVLNFSLAVSVGTKENPKTEWIDCALWGKLAESLAPYISKGKFLCVDGQAGIRTWLAKEDSGPRGAITCRVDTLTFGPNREAENALQAPQEGYTAQKPVAVEDDIPF